MTETETCELQIIYYIDNDDIPFFVKRKCFGELILKEIKIIVYRPNIEFVKYFFKFHDDEFGVIKQEISDDSAVVPSIDGKIICYLITAGGLNSRTGRWDLFMTLLKQSISRPKKEVVEIIAERYYNGVDAAARSATGALNFYNLIKNLPSSSTKLVLEDKLNLHINGPVSLTKPNILSAIDENMDQFVIKLLRVSHDMSYDKQREEFVQEKETCSILRLEKPQVALCPVKIISIEYDKRLYVALKMPRFLNTLQDVPRVFPNAILFQGRKLAEALSYMHTKEIVHMDIKADNILISADKRWVISDFGSSKFVGDKVTTSNLTFFAKFKLDTAEKKYDWFMLLLVFIKECLEDRSKWISVFCDENEKYDPVAIDKYIQEMPTGELRSFLLQLQSFAGSCCERPMNN